MENLSYEILMNFKNSVKAIEKVLKEIERHPENKKLLYTTVRKTLVYQSVNDFRIIYLKRVDIDEDSFKSEYDLEEKISIGNSRYYFSYESPDGEICRQDFIEQTLRKSEKTDQRYQKIMAINGNNELLLFVIDRNVPMTKEEKKIIKNLLDLDV